MGAAILPHQGCGKRWKVVRQPENRYREIYLNQLKSNPNSKSKIQAEIQIGIRIHDQRFHIFSQTKMYGFINVMKMDISCPHLSWISLIQILFLLQLNKSMAF